MLTLADHQNYLRAAKERASTNKLLIHSLSEARELIFDLIERLEIKTVCEIGSEGGFMSAGLHTLYKSGILTGLTVVDPYPTAVVSAYADGLGCSVVAKTSAEALKTLNPHDLYIVDGDHNYHTVYEELKSVLTTNPQALVIMHDVCWPWAYRDLYYDVTTLPTEAVLPLGKGGLHPKSEGMVRYGFDGLGQYEVASVEGGQRNGVFNAVETIAEEFPVAFSSIPALFGIGFLRSKSYAKEGRLQDLIDLGAIEPFIWRLEENRLTNYLRVIELQGLLSERDKEMVDIRNGRISLSQFGKIVFKFFRHRISGRSA
jgi:predicted O-methyltransferase YrrM